MSTDNQVADAGPTRVVLYGIGPDDTASVHFVVSMLTLQNRLVLQTNIVLEFDIARSVNEAIGKFYSSDKKPDVMVAIDKSCRFLPEFVLANTSDAVAPMVVGVCPETQYNWDRMLDSNNTQEPLDEKPLQYNVDLKDVCLGFNSRLVDVDVSRITSSPGIIIRRACLDSILIKFPERTDASGHVALFVEEIREKTHFKPLQNFLDLFAKCCGSKVKVDLLSPLGIMGSMAFEGSCGSRSVLR